MLTLVLNARHTWDGYGTDGTDGTDRDDPMVTRDDGVIERSLTAAIAGLIRLGATSPLTAPYGKPNDKAWPERVADAHREARAALTQSEGRPSPA